MRRRLLAACALAASGSAAAGCNPLHARFADESARIALTTLAADAGWRLANPEVIRGTLEAELDDSDAAQLLPRLAWQLGLEVRVRGDEVWLHEVDGRA